MTRQQVRGGGRQWEAEKDQPVVRGHRARHAREQRAGEIGDRLRMHAQADRALELLHHRERIVVAPDDLHAEHALGRRAEDRSGDRHRDDGGQCRTAATSATRPGKVDHRREDQHRARDRPAAHIAHVRRQAGVAGEGLQRQQACRLREPEHREPGEEARPAHGDEGRNPQREIEADLERGEKRHALPADRRAARPPET